MQKLEKYSSLALTIGILTLKNIFKMLKAKVVDNLMEIFFCFERFRRKVTIRELE